MMTACNKLTSWSQPTKTFLEGGFYSFAALATRLYLAQIFFKSGLLKFENYLNGNWEATVQLFEYVHPVPFLPAELAAIFGTMGELTLPVLLAFGLFGRFAALGLLVMTIVIQIALQAEVHELWMLLFALLLAKGPGRFSLDNWLCKGLCNRS